MRDALIAQSSGGTLWCASNTDLAATAASYAVGLARDHPFVDGNKRIALIALATFLDLNGLELTATADELVERMLAVADGSRSEEERSGWIRQHSGPLRD